MALKKLFPVLVLLLTLLACQSDRNRRVAEISSLNTELKAALDTLPLLPAENAEEVKSLISLSEEFVEKYPEDTMSPLYLYDVGKKYMAIHKYEEAMKAFDKLVDSYPMHRLAPEGLYATGVLYEKNFENYDYARQRYEIFLERFPDHPLAQGLDMVIMYLGDDFGLLEAIRSKNKEGIEAETIPQTKID